MADYLGMQRISILLALATIPALAQTPVLEGDWSGALSVGGGSLRLALHIDKAPDGLYTGKLNSLDQGAVLPIDSITLTGDKVHLEVKQVMGTFDGVLSGDKLKGTWSQGAPLPLEFTRQSAAAAPRPEPPHLTAASMQPFGVTADLRVPYPPTPVLLDGKTQMIYELAITNATGSIMDLQRLEVL